MRKHLAIVAITLAACGGGSSNTSNGGGGGGGGATDFATICAAVMTAQTSLMQTCFKVNPSLFTSPGSYQMGGGCTAMQAEITAGRIHYDATKGPACAAAYQAFTCASLSPNGGIGAEPAACTAALIGTVANGGNCYMGNDCANGYCTADWTGTCPGTCQAYVAAGGNCTSGGCAPGLECDYSGMSPTCKAPGAAGAACPCQAGLRCDTSGSTPVCRALIAAGGSCPLYNYGQCAVGFQCVGTTTGTCQAVQGLGGPCTTTDRCGDGYQCVSGACAAWPSVGQACGMASYNQCIGGYCDTATSLCKTYLADGATCTVLASAACLSGSCNAATLKCDRSICGP